MRHVPISPSLQIAARKFALASLVIGIGLALGACSSARETASQSPAWATAQAAAAAPQRQAAYEPAAGDPIKDAPIEPRRSPNTVPDDPNEPFSPNYGGPRDRPPVHVSDATPTAHDPEPEPDGRQTVMRLPDKSRAYFRRVTTTAAAD